MPDATNHEPPEAAGPPTEAAGRHADPAIRNDDTIRLNWREKLVEFGMMMAVVMSGMLIGLFVIIASLLTLHSTFEDLAPGFADTGTIPFIILAIVAVIIGNICSFSCAPYLIRLLYRGNELKDERMDRTIKHLISVTGMDIRVDRIYVIKGRTANAVVAGLFRKAQCIFLTNRLLERMTEGEIMSALAHELAHVRHRHIPKVMLAVVLWALGIQLLFWLIGFHAYFRTIDPYTQIWVNSGMAMLNIYLLMFLVLFPLSRRHEYQADATAARWVGVSQYKQAVYRLYQLNDQLKPPRKILAKLDSHPMLQKRLERVGRLE